MKTKYKYTTAQEAYVALNNELNNSYFDWDSMKQIDFWLKEFIREDEEDLAWLNLAVNSISHDCITIEMWFYNQSQYPELWSEKSFKLIEAFSDAYKSFDY